jgi:hypothetical protein
MPSPKPLEYRSEMQNYALTRVDRDPPPPPPPPLPAKLPKDDPLYAFYPTVLSNEVPRHVVTNISKDKPSSPRESRILTLNDRDEEYNLYRRLMKIERAFGLHYTKFSKEYYDALKGYFTEPTEGGRRRKSRKSKKSRRKTHKKRK